MRLPRFHRREDRPNRNEATNFPRSRWNSTPHMLLHFHRTRLDDSSSSQMRYTHANFHLTRPQLICRDDRLRFRRGKNSWIVLCSWSEIYPSMALAVRAAKRAISQVTEFPFETGVEFERASNGRLLHSKDRLEPLEVFKAKRLFKGE